MRVIMPPILLANANGIRKREARMPLAAAMLTTMGSMRGHSACIAHKCSDEGRGSHHHEKEPKRTVSAKQKEFGSYYLGQTGIENGASTINRPPSSPR